MLLKNPNERAGVNEIIEYLRLHFEQISSNVRNEQVSLATNLRELRSHQ